jgi:monoamine oxidase
MRRIGQRRNCDRFARFGRLMISRRIFTASCAALLASATHARAADADVLVVGAGAAGIGAARELRKQGKSVILVEARQRAGGRVYTDQSLGARFDGGAAYIHFSERNPWTKIAEDLNVPTRGGMRLWAGSVAYRDGQPLTSDQALERSAAQRRVWEAYDEIEPRQDVSLAQAVAEYDDLTKAAARIQAQMAAGENPENISVSDWQSLESGGNLLVDIGYGTLAEKAAQPLDVRFDTLVREIDLTGPLVRVATNKGDIRVRKVILTVSVGVLRAGDIKFLPELPLDHQRALDGLRMGALSKVAFTLDGPKLEFKPHQFLAEIGRPNEAMTFETYPFDQDIVVAVFGGDYARGLVKQGEKGAVDHVLERFARIAGEDARKKFRNGRLIAWSEDPFSRGSYAVVTPGRLKAREMLARPIKDRLWLAGEATAGPYSMTAGGAYLSGQKAATEIVARLRGVGTR